MYKKTKPDFDPREEGNITKQIRVKYSIKVKNKFHYSLGVIRLNLLGIQVDK